MLVRNLSPAQKRRARKQAKALRRAMAKNCKVWHGEAAQAYYEQLVREGKIKTAVPMTGPVNPGRNSCQPARNAGVSDNASSSRVEVADAPPEGAKPQVHNAGCAMKPPGQSVGTDSKIDSLAQKNVLTLAQVPGGTCETVGDNPSVQMTGPGSCQAVEPNPSPDKGSRNNSPAPIRRQ